MDIQSNIMQIIGIGNPLLDITATVDDDFLNKYELPKNSAIIANNRHETMYDEIVNNYSIDYSAGGSAQTALRFCQWVIGKNNPLTTFLGAVGNDYFGKIMEKYARNEGVSVRYQVDQESNTGTCAVLVTDGGKSRTLCAYLGASQKFAKEFLDSNVQFVDRARLIYTTGHMLSVSAESVLQLARLSHQTGKYLFFNLGAPYVAEKQSSDLNETLLYVDFFFSNRDEALSLASVKGYNTADIKEVAKQIASEPKMKSTGNAGPPDPYKQGRVVVVTQAEKPVLLARSDSDKVLEFPVKNIAADKLNDTNGAGDAFVGGFLAMFATGQPIEECVRCAIYCAAESVQQLGCTLPVQMSFELS